DECAIIEVPADTLSRFLVLPKTSEAKRIILLDDVIRFNLQDIFMTFGFTECDAYTIKITRDAELDIDDDILQSFVDKISDSLKKRKLGNPVRFIHDSEMPDHLLRILRKILYIRKSDNIIPGGRYHNFKNFISFPNIGAPNLRYKPSIPLSNGNINPHKSLLSIIKKKDIFLHYPYQSFHYIIDLLREASIDPDVVSIKATLYRVARKSNVINALINAAKNGKEVTVVMELQARFDEEANIYWTKRLREEGAKVIIGVPGIKVHSKLCLITRQENDKTVHYAHIGTGNFNEVTAQLYCDDSLLTAESKITNEVNKIFTFIESNFKFFEEDQKKRRFKNLLVSPFNMRAKIYKLIDYEIRNAKAGQEAYCILKMNSLSDVEMIDKLYEASQAGVPITLHVRGLCCLRPGIPGLSENIEAYSILDKYLEHSRIFIFCHGGKEKYYISSADLMTRNLNFRIEVACPIYNKELQKDLRSIVDIQLNDNIKTRIWNKRLTNKYKTKPLNKKVRAQTEIYNYFKNKAAHSE
ncbi:polyphosphate kinase 1, partial [bacterium]|nr:polyphosphate kinase 1 [bacterium]